MKGELEDHIDQEIKVRLAGQKSFKKAILSMSSKGLYVRYGLGRCDWIKEIEEWKV